MSTWLIDPETREPLAAIKPADGTLRRLGRDMEWLGEHHPSHPSWEISTVDSLGFQYARRCQRPCVHQLGWDGKE